MHTLVCVASAGLRILSLGFGVSSGDTYQVDRSIRAGMPPLNIRRQHIGFHMTWFHIKSLALYTNTSEHPPLNPPYVCYDRNSAMRQTLTHTIAP